MSETTQELLKQYLSGNLSAEQQLETLLPRSIEGSELLVACRPDEYSASAIARAVEDCDARLVSLSVTAMRTANDYPVVLVRTDSRNSQSVERSLTRYGFTTVHADSTLTPEQQSQAIARINELIHYLDM